MFTNEAAEFLLGTGIDKKYINQGKDLLNTPKEKKTLRIVVKAEDFENQEIKLS